MVLSCGRGEGTRRKGTAVYLGGKWKGGVESSNITWPAIISQESRKRQARMGQEAYDQTRRMWGDQTQKKTQKHTEWEKDTDSFREIDVIVLSPSQVPLSSNKE